MIDERSGEQVIVDRVGCDRQNTIGIKEEIRCARLVETGECKEKDFYRRATSVRIRLRLTLFIFARDPCSHMIHLFSLRNLYYRLSRRSDFCCFSRNAHAVHTFVVRNVDFHLLGVSVSRTGRIAKPIRAHKSERARTHRIQKQNIQLIWNCINKSLALVPEQRTHLHTAQSEIQISECVDVAVVDNSSAFLYAQRHTICIQHHSSGHGSISAQEFLPFFFLLAAVGLYGREATARRKKCRIRCPSALCSQCIWTFHLVLTSLARCRRFHFASCSFESFGDSIFFRVRRSVGCAMTPLIYFIEMACVQRAVCCVCTPSKALQFTIHFLR